MINTGIYIFEPEVLDFVPEGVPFDIGADLFPQLVANGAPFYALPMDFEWVDIGKMPDYWQAIRSMLRAKSVGRIPARKCVQASTLASMWRRTGTRSTSKGRSTSVA